MSISLLTTPQKIQPVFNPIYIRCSSTNSTQNNFKFIFDLYVESVFVTRVKLQPRPLSTSTIFSPARILESYVSFDNLVNITSGATGVNTFSQYTVQIGEEYDLASTGTTVYSGLSSTSGYTFNGVIPYEQVPNWDYLDYTISSSASTASFLTNSPSRKLIRDDERESLGIFFSGISIAFVLDMTVVVTITKITGGTITQSFSILSAISGYSGTYNIGSGIYNLNQWLTTDIDPSQHSQYTVKIVLTNINGDYTVSEIKTYVVDSECTKYDTTRFMFLNSLGQFDYFTAKMFNKKNVGIERTTYKKVLAYNYAVGDRGNTVIDIKANQKHSVISDWIDTDTSEWLTELFLSPEVYVLNEDSSIIPIVIDNNSIDVRRTENEKLINYTFDYTLANPLNTLRG